MLSLRERLKKREQLGNLRHLQVGRPPIDFASNDYLGLARSSAFAAAIRREWWRCERQMSCRFGSTGSRLLTGNSEYAQRLEESIAAFHGYETGVLFNCGYMANSGLLSVVADQQSVIFFDEGIHASTREGIRLSRATAFPFRHNDSGHLESRLKKSSSQRERWVCAESVYSTDGTMAPLVEISRIAKKYEARLIVDEAHATGVLGPGGRGLVAEYGIMDHVDAQVVTFGKALGTCGAIVLGDRTLKQALINFSHPYIYTTALPFPILASIKCSYDLFPQMEKEREQLQRLIEVFKNASAIATPTMIQPVLISGNAALRHMAEQVSLAGFDVCPLMSPTVRRGHELLRICLHAFNSEEELQNLCKLLKANGSA